MAKFGGHIRATLSTGVTLPLRGTLNMSTARQSNEAITNQDGSLAISGTPRSPTAEITFQDDGVDYDALMKADPFNLTFEEEFTNVSHYYTRASVIGEPVVNRVNGEVTGCTIVAEAYNRSR